MGIPSFEGWLLEVDGCLKTMIKDGLSVAEVGRYWGSANLLSTESMRPRHDSKLYPWNLELPDMLRSY
jgi:hypothetical protein